METGHVSRTLSDSRRFAPELRIGARERDASNFERSLRLLRIAKGFTRRRFTL
jgi:hypothetical protein